MSGFDVAKLKMRDKRILKDVLEETDYVHLSDALEILGDLQKTLYESFPLLDEHPAYPNLERKKLFDYIGKIGEWWKRELEATK